jgi:tetratricopeptide (TPR) repeat protein
MRRRLLLSGGLCALAPAARARCEAPATTHGSIAVANLDADIQRRAGEPEVIDLWLLRMQFLADYSALDHVAALVAAVPATPAALLLRVRARAAAHRFTDAMTDLEAAAAAGADARKVKALRASLLIATGRAGEALPGLEADALRQPGFASQAALARAYGAAGRLDDADRLYGRSLGVLDTTSPFPLAAIEFARGMMWAEQGGAAIRGAAHYARALQAVPQFVAAGIHLAEIERAHGAQPAAQERLQRIATASDEPQAWALLGELQLQQGQAAQGQAAILRARQRHESLLARHPSAFADHAAEFYLGAGQDVQRAWSLAQANLRERATRRAYGLAWRAAEAAGLTDEGRRLRRQMRIRHAPQAA